MEIVEFSSAWGDVRPEDGEQLGQDLLRRGIQILASDTDLLVGHPIYYHCSEGLVQKPPFPDQPELAGREFIRVCRWFVSHANPFRQDGFLRQLRADTIFDAAWSCPVADEWVRLRFHFYVSNAGLGITIRFLPSQPPELYNLGYSSDIRHALELLTSRKSGLGLISGPTGSGKSTTLAALVSHIITSSPRKVICLEDPIEYVYPKTSRLGLVVSKEKGDQFQTYHRAIYDSLRERPQVLIVQEARDQLTLEAMFSAAQTGVLVLGTLHARGIISTLRRVADLFGTRNKEALSMLSSNGLFILSQQLVPSVTNGKSCLSIEFFRNTTPQTREAIHSFLERTSNLRHLLNESEHYNFKKSLEGLRDDQKITTQTLQEYLPIEGD